MTYTLPLDEAHNLCMAIQTVECVCVWWWWWCSFVQFDALTRPNGKEILHRCRYSQMIFIFISNTSIDIFFVVVCFFRLLSHFFLLLFLCFWDFGLFACGWFYFRNKCDEWESTQMYKPYKLKLFTHNTQRCFNNFRLGLSFWVYLCVCLCQFFFCQPVSIASWSPMCATLWWYSNEARADEYATKWEKRPSRANDIK